MEENTENTENVENTEQEEKSVITKEDMRNLKRRADTLGLKYSPNIGFEKLSQRINEELEKQANPNKEDNGNKTLTSSTSNPKMEAREKAMKLIRVNVSCKNPNKKEWQGEIITGGNAIIGTVKKFVLFNEAYHVPQIIYNTMKERKFQRFYKKRVNDKEVTKSKLVPEFDITLLDPLSEEELRDLAQRQAMSGSTKEEDE